MKGRKTTVEEMKEQLKKVHGDNIEYVSGYECMSRKCWFRCKYGHMWKAYPYQLINKRQGCPECYRLSRIIPLEEVKRRVFILTNGMIEYVEGYIDTHKKCKWKCIKCGHVWETTPHNIFEGNRCPCCIMDSMEEPIIKLLDSKNVIYLHDKPIEGCMSANNGFLRFDFQIPTNKGLLILETDGQQHFIQMRHRENLQKQQEKDATKNKFCKDNNIILIRVTSSHTRKWGTPKHITLKELFDLIDKGISANGEVNLEVFRPYDFNRD